MTPFLVSAIVSFTLFLFVLGMRPNTMKAHGKEGMFRQLPLMVDAFLERRLHIPERRPMADFGVRSGGRVFDFDFPDVAEHLFRGNGLALDAGFLSFAYSFELGSLVFGCFFGIFFGYWLRSIYFRDPAQPTRFSDIITACVFLAIAFLGILGPSVVAGAFSRLTALKIGGTELTFAEGHPKGETGSNDTSLAALVPPSSGGGTQAASPETSGGLRFLADLPLLFPARHILLPPHEAAGSR